MADATTTDTPSLDDLLEFIRDFAVQQYRERARSTHGSILADAIRHRFPDFSYEAVGLDRLADAVAKAEERGLVVRDRNVAHLEIVPGPATGVDAKSLGAAKPRYLRPEIWRALVFVTSHERHFINRETGSVRSIPSDEERSIGTHSADPNSAELPRIPAETQQAWVRAYIQSQETLDPDDAPLRDPQWWVRVPEWLREKGAEFERGWRRERSQRVIAAAVEWAKENAVSETLLFAPPRSKPSELPWEEETDETRRALLAALGDMPLHELENLSIPVRYVVRYFRAR